MGVRVVLGVVVGMAVGGQEVAGRGVGANAASVGAAGAAGKQAARLPKPMMSSSQTGRKSGFKRFKLDTDRQGHAPVSIQQGHPIISLSIHVCHLC